MLVKDLIAALQALPADAEVIMPDAWDVRDEDGLEFYAKLGVAEIRYVYRLEIENINWDFAPTIEPWPEAVPVVLLKSMMCERDDYSAPTWDGSQRTYRRIPARAST